MKFSEVQVVEDDDDSLGYVKRIVENKEQEDAFYVLDVGEVIRKHKNWLSKIPRVEPHFAVKCNPDQTVIKVLAALGAGFDCASKQEIAQVLAAEVLGERIIFANPMKPPSHIKYARTVGVRNLTVDSEEELYKIKNIFPEASVIIRFRCDAAEAGVQLGGKSGCDPEKDVPRLTRLTKDLGLHLRGFSFHVGSQCGELLAYNRGIEVAVGLIEYAESLGFGNARLIDIGGGFPGDNDSLFDDFARTINKALEDVDPSIKVISEPGTYYVASAFTLACSVFGKKTVDVEHNTRYMYYVNDGVLGSFKDVLLTSKIRIPILLNKPLSEKKHLSTFWGPTLDPLDCVLRDIWFPECHIEDWLVWTNMGDYTLSLAGTFNGFLPPIVFPFIRRNMWNSLNLEQGIVDKNSIHLETENNGRIENCGVIPSNGMAKKNDVTLESTFAVKLNLI